MQYIRVDHIEGRGEDGQVRIFAIFEITPQEYARIIDERNQAGIEAANEAARRARIEAENEADRARERKWYVNHERELTE